VSRQGEFATGAQSAPLLRHESTLLVRPAKTY